MPDEYKTRLTNNLKEAKEDTEHLKSQEVPLIGGETEDGHFVLKGKAVYERKNTGELHLVVSTENTDEDERLRIAAKFNKLTGHKPVEGE